MNDILVPPTERDLPPDRAARMRTAVLAAAHRPHRPALRQVAVVGALAAAVAVGVTATALRGGDGFDLDADVRALAMSTSELSPDLRGAAEQCLRWNADREELPGSTDHLRVSMDDLAVAAQRGHDAAMLFLADDGYFDCSVSREPGQEPTGGTSSDRWNERRDWLPGPVQRLGLTSSDLDGGDVTVTGRVSARVHRLVLDHGDGHTTAARLAGGVFGLVSDGVPVRANASLVAYDAAGNELVRRTLFDKERDERCYVDPAGTVVYGERGTATCLPAERWTP